MTTSEDGEARDKFGAFFDANPVPIIVWRRSGDDFVLTEDNPAAAAFAEAPMAELRGLRAGAFAASTPEVLDAIRRCFDSRGAVRADYWFSRLLSGRRVFIEALFAFVEPDLVLEMLVDATAEKLREEALEIEKGRLEAALAERVTELDLKVAALEATRAELAASLHRIDALTANIGVGVFRFRRDASGFSVDYLSLQACRLCGFTREEGLANPMAFFERSLAAEGPAFLAAMDEAIQACRGISWEGEAIVAGKVRVLRIEMEPEPGCGDVVVYNGMVSDITAERLEHLNRVRLVDAVERMAHSLASFRDSLRAPATGVSGAWGSLSKREAEVVDLLLQGLSNKEIAERLFIAESTVKKHVNLLFDKLGVGSRAELFSLARRKG